ncbi:WD40 repeat-like-containing domain protein [Niveomyces insectorum RCEF 264]|uniref:WD40 repeat-like-containing domain protein n=1 Tax=Niveomyces insectorum RCEF 264 TaxID=1081102 RepID=A0A162IAP3_9HYPO|nr:WD40 repeat-like-containing domain protein [Niveomyces insectorum RCEF 264]
MASPVEIIQSQTLDLPPSCVEFCPAYPDHLLVGTYNLEEDEERAQGDSTRPQNRNGSVVVFRLADRKLSVNFPTFSHTPSAVLDLHFQQVSGRQNIFAVASSTATLSIFRLEPSGAATDQLVEPAGIVRLPGVGDEVLFLSCAWHPTVPDLVAVSTSTGAIYVVALDPLQQPSGTPKSVLLHELEAWTVTFSPFTQQIIGDADGDAGGDADDKEANVEGATSARQDARLGRGPTAVTIYSGGDDSDLLYTACVVEKSAARENTVALHTPYAVRKLRGHEAGVTAILPLPLTTAMGGQVVVTGSYDDHLRVYSVRDPVDDDAGGARQAKCLAEENLGGGVWRLKLISQTASDDGRRWEAIVLASCMHAGARVVSISADADDHCIVSVVARCEEHKSMNYGSDFQLDTSLLCVSTSFYDKLMCLWEVKNWHSPR